MTFTENGTNMSAMNANTLTVFLNRFSIFGNSLFHVMFREDRYEFVFCGERYVPRVNSSGAYVLTFVAPDGSIWAFNPPVTRCEEPENEPEVMIPLYNACRFLLSRLAEKARVFDWKSCIDNCHMSDCLADMAQFFDYQTGKITDENAMISFFAYEALGEIIAGNRADYWFFWDFEGDDVELAFDYVPDYVRAVLRDDPIWDAVHAELLDSALDGLAGLFA